MTKTPTPGVIRPDGIPIDVYNEGLLVYLYDENLLSVAAKMIASGKYEGADEGQFFINHLENKAFAKDLQRKRLFAYYELQQDDEVSAEVCVGQPLTDQERSVARWLAPQQTRMNLPSGKLCIESPNSFRLDDEDHEDEGAIVPVQAGEYVVTLYRIDWEEMRREEIKNYRGPQEVIVLTPLGEAHSVPKTKLYLPFVIKTDSTWVGKYQIKGKTFEAMLNFFSYWEQCVVNLDERAAQQLSLQPGQRFQVKAEGFVIEALYLGDVKITDFLNHYGREKLDKELSRYKEFTLAEWNPIEGKPVMWLYRRKGSKAAPERLLNTWVPCTGEVLDERWESPLFTRPEPAHVEPGRLTAQVMSCSLDEILISIKRNDLKAAGFHDGQAITLLTPRGKHVLVLDLDAEPWKVYVLLTPALPEQMEGMMLKLKGTYGCVTLADSVDYPKYQGPVPVTVLPTSPGWPLFGTFSGSADKANALLRLKPMYLNTGDPPKSWSQGLQDDVQVILQNV